MGLFRKRRQQELPPKEETIDVEMAIAEISARQAFLQALAFRLATELPPKKRDHLLEELQEVVRGLMSLPQPTHVPHRRLQDYRAELGRRMQFLIEKVGSKLTS